MKGGGAPFYSALCAALCAMRSRKRPCQPKTAKRIFGGPGSQGPPGRQKSERVFCLFGGFFLRPARRAMCRAGRSCAADRCCGGFCDRCSGVFSAGVSLPCSRPAAVCRCCLACAAAARRLCAGLPAGAPAFCGFVPGPHASPPAGFVRIFAPAALFARRALSCTHFCLVLAALFARPVLCARVFLLSFTLSCLTSSSQKSFHLSLRP